MNLDKSTALTVASADPIRELMKAVADEADGRRRYLGRKVTVQAVVNGLVLWLGSLDRETRARVIDEGLAMIGRCEAEEWGDEDVARLKEMVASPEGDRPEPPPTRGLSAVDMTPKRSRKPGRGAKG